LYHGALDHGKAKFGDYFAHLTIISYTCAGLNAYIRKLLSFKFLAKSEKRQKLSLRHCRENILKLAAIIETYMYE